MLDFNIFPEFTEELNRKGEKYSNHPYPVPDREFCTYTQKSERLYY